MRMRHETIGTLFDVVYLALAGNLLFVLGAAPVLAVALVTDTSRSWPLVALAAPLAAPGLCGLFAVFAGYRAGRSTAVVATFARAWRASLRRAVQLGAAAAGALVVLGVDARAAWGRPVGAVAIPVLATGMLVVVAAALLGLAALAERPAARLRDVARVSAYLGIRAWPLTLLSLTVLALLLTLFTARPAIALGLAAAPLLYVVWANSRFALRAALEPQGETAHDVS
ncbi:hypothetical protein Dvina_39255 [Dactylosporangium vinaceum]|uniref:Ferredoxin-NADPH reductase n=1 Tax=Dactylosporangium vinaceum TaxID=53362 RepID=A0ABV5MKL9_9ACTN|nr:hypothetical protein [Dactylosporangium vinaceum]UAB94175.1 hypothetical protein Dvina_39255 [Dactylosporangium vinaceum]